MSSAEDPKRRRIGLFSPVWSHFLSLPLQTSLSLSVSISLAQPPNPHLSLVSYLSFLFHSIPAAPHSAANHPPPMKALELTTSLKPYFLRLLVSTVVRPTFTEQSPVCLGNKWKRWRGLRKSNSCVPRATERTGTPPTGNVFSLDKPPRSRHPWGLRSHPQVQTH